MDVNTYTIEVGTRSAFNAFVLNLASNYRKGLMLDHKVVYYVRISDPNLDWRRLHGGKLI